MINEDKFESGLILISITQQQESTQCTSRSIVGLKDLLVLVPNVKNCCKAFKRVFKDLAKSSNNMSLVNHYNTIMRITSDGNINVLSINNVITYLYVSTHKHTHQAHTFDNIVFIFTCIRSYWYSAEVDEYLTDVLWSLSWFSWSPVPQITCSLWRHE